MINVRKMEETGGTLGLTDSINSTDLTSNGESSNNIDIHMQKNTEYGAMAILSASSYGNQNVIANGETTTGNETGVYIYYNAEWVAAGVLQGVENFTNANSKYKNQYQDLSYIEMNGDAIIETRGWHDAALGNWLDTSYGAHLGADPWNAAGLLRGESNGIFSYNGCATACNRTNWWSLSPYATNPHYTRAVIVVGKDF